MTGQNTRTDLIAGMDAGADDFIAKPFNGEELRVRVQAGARLTELMKQPQYSPLTNAEIVVVIFAGTNGFLDNLALADVSRFEKGLLAHMHSKHSDVMDWITNEDPKVKGDAADKIKAAIDEYAADFA